MADPSKSAALLECLSNLAGNEMHGSEAFDPRAFDENFGELSGRICADIVRLSDKIAGLIVVANTFPADDDSYDEETKAYVRLNNTLTEKIRLLADRVVDV